MASAEVSKVFDVDPEKVWGAIRQFNNMDKYIPFLVKTCSVVGSGEGARRVCGTENGDIFETLTLLDDANKTLEYTVDNEDAPLPLSDYKARAVVESLSENRARLTWSATFEAKGMPEGDVSQLLEAVYAGLLENLVASVSDA